MQLNVLNDLTEAMKALEGKTISAKSRFMSYSLRRSSSSCKVVSRWMHRCLTAPSMCMGHPTGICDSLRSPSPFCSIIVPNIGTSIEVLRLTLVINASSLIMSRRPCMGSDVPCPELGGGPCCVLEPGGTNGFDPCHASGIRAFDTFSAKAVIHWGGSSMQGRIGQRIGHSMQHGGLWA